ncbi:MAG: GNAT family N-acetyltransferase [Lachnospiraceae bacterium]
MKLYYDDKTRKKEIYNLYQLIFKDPEEFARYYFSEVYEKNRCLLLEEDGKIGAMLHQNPYQVMVGEQEFSLSYIVAVSTREELRRRGCMRALLCRTLEDLAKKGEPFTYLMPAKKEYYEPFDFAFIMDWYTFRTEKIDEKRAIGKDFSMELEIQNEKNIRQIAKKMNETRRNYANVYTKMSFELLERLEKEQNCEGGHIFLIREGEQCLATGMYTNADGEIQITNLLIEQEEKKNEIILFLRQKFSSYAIEWISYDRYLLDKTCEKKPLIMARILRVDILLPLLKSTKKQQFIIEVKDNYLENNNGKFLWKMDENGSSLEKTDGEPDVCIEIADLTEIIFGYTHTKERYLKDIIPLSPVYITEVV